MDRPARIIGFNANRDSAPSIRNCLNKRHCQQKPLSAAWIDRLPLNTFPLWNDEVNSALQWTVAVLQPISPDMLCEIRIWCVCSWRLERKKQVMEMLLKQLWELVGGYSKWLLLFFKKYMLFTFFYDLFFNRYPLLTAHVSSSIVASEMRFKRYILISQM